MPPSPDPITDPHKPWMDDLDAALTAQAPITVAIERRRFGKEMTVLAGFGATADLAGIARELKHRLAVGGSVKDGRIELQGDQRKRLAPALEALGLRLAAT